MEGATETKFDTEKMRDTTLADEKYDACYRNCGCPIGKNMSDST